MIDELIDLTTMQPSKVVLRTRFTPTDLMCVVGGVPYLAREAFRYLFQGRPTVVDQLKVLAELIAAGEAKAKSLKVRISTAAKTRWEMPESIQEANVLGENADTHAEPISQALYDGRLPRRYSGRVSTRSVRGSLRCGISARPQSASGL
jgi:hypothetical protein